jgi:sec-independent protein translocase protein TatA
VIGDILQPTHLLFVLVIALLVLGPKRLPEVGRSLGKGLRDFKNALSGEDHSSREELSPTTADSTTPAPERAERIG